MFCSIRVFLPKSVVSVFHWSVAIVVSAVDVARSTEVSVLHVNASMTAFGKATHWQVPDPHAQSVLIMHEGRSSGSLVPNSREQACMELFFSLPELKATPDVVTYSAAISACQKALDTFRGFTGAEENPVSRS